ncbi:uncharacterized protein DUF4417 [Krasilnikovia cinnamomea]|uniref:Uncharacterized protein DUF4417 n=1 Tax=Krasilnikovia cinnamomea TaxID=349313 RepID=A0A4Q7ZA42_9ACTN|nr:DUF4417 domain-containing protein [Krasilnikovia cinnamomea]RZU46659.1 uncharacterized protein DUF4417 [Krasilnikovia cinnamomea]
MPINLPLLAPAAGCDCRRCPWYAGPDPVDASAVIAPLCSGSNPDCSYCGCARAEATATTAAGTDVCRTCPVRCGSRTDIGAWMADVGGTLEFDDIDLGERRLPAGLPRFVPQTDGSAVTTWDAQLRWPAYGVGLRRVFSPDTASLYRRFTDRDVHEVLGLRPGQLAVLVGYGLDPLVEAFWSRRRVDRLVERIAAMGWDLVLAPNYSIFGNWPRAQHLLSMRMSLLIADEFVNAGMNTVPNLYWYRLEDLRRWAAWVDDTDPPAVAINLQTVRQDSDWQTWVLPGLHWLAENLPAHLPVIITGLSRAARIDLAVELFGSRLHLVSQNPHQFALHGAVMTAGGRQDLHARPVDAFTASVTYMASLLDTAEARR